MGGMGSGKRSTHGQMGFAADCCRLDIRLWKRRGLLHPGKVFEGTIGSSGSNGSHPPVRVRMYRDDVEVTTSSNGPSHESNEVVIALERTPCALGGERVWFRCPKCYRRAAVLYLASEIMCRTCAKLKYETQYLSKHTRCLSTCRSIRWQLGGSANLLERFPDRPKGMRQARYYKLWRRSFRAEEFYWLDTARRFHIETGVNT
jgi:hypothetical protein